MAYLGASCKPTKNIGLPDKKFATTSVDSSNWEICSGLPLADNAYNIWSDGTNIYYSSNGKNKVLNGNTWEDKAWEGLTTFYGRYVWTDGTNIYYSYFDNVNVKDNQYILDGNTWVAKDWGDLFPRYGEDIWTDGTNIYYSHDANQYILDGNTWVAKDWGDAYPRWGGNIWTDGTNIYYSQGTGGQLVLNEGVWQSKTWNNRTGYIDGSLIWSDGTNIYSTSYSDSTPYRLNGNTWEKSAIAGLSAPYGNRMWTDGKNIYYYESSYGKHRVLLTSDSKLYTKGSSAWSEIASLAGGV